ncbi:PIN domain-containing protein [Streptomyces sp. NPDC004266]|uniref:PIN domain-containing protein n=1 Tax=Streptomyces sp. NPDC004266 TaxID=3364693 RepID=UPI0036CEF909
MIRVLLDHTCVQALAKGDEFLNGLYVEASYGHAELVVPAMSAVAAERESRGAGQHVLQRRFITVEDFTREHALMGIAWAGMDWRVAHPAASVILAERAGISATLLSLTPREYIGTGVGALDPRE